MKFQVDRDAMADAVNWASRTLPNKSTQPLLTGLHLVAEKSSLVLSGSDADVSGQASVNADVEQPGTVLVPGRLLADITKSLPSAKIEFALSGNQVNITVAVPHSPFQQCQLVNIHHYQTCLNLAEVFQATSLLLLFPK